MASKKRQKAIDSGFNTVNKNVSGIQSKIENSINRLEVLVSNFVGGIEINSNIDINLSRTAVDQIIVQSGFFQVVNELLNQGYGDILNESLKRHQRLFNNVIELSEESLNRLTILKQADLIQYQKITDAFGIDLNNQVINLSLDAIDASSVLTILNETLIPRVRNNVRTIIDTGLKGIYRTGNNLIAKEAGIKKFQYVGGLIATSRDFCKNHLGEIKTLAEWDSLASEQGQIAPVSTFLGGFNCQHDLVGVT